MDYTAAVGEWNGLIYDFYVFIVKIFAYVNIKIAMLANIYNLKCVIWGVEYGEILHFEAPWRQVTEIFKGTWPQIARWRGGLAPRA